MWKYFDDRKKRSSNGNTTQLRRQSLHNGTKTQKSVCVHIVTWPKWKPFDKNLY